MLKFITPNSQRLKYEIKLINCTTIQSICNRINNHTYHENSYPNTYNKKNITPHNSLTLLSIILNTKTFYTSPSLSICKIFQNTIVQKDY